MPNKTIVINGKETSYEKDSLSYEEIIILAHGSYNPNITYTVLFYAGKSENVKGSVVKDEIIDIHPNMVFNVRKTTQS